MQRSRSAFEREDESRRSALAYTVPLRFCEWGECAIRRLCC